MKHAVIIQCHNNPAQISEIIRFANQEQFDFYIHVDKKSDIATQIIQQKNVFFVSNEDRIDVRWGGFSQVQATLASIKMVATSGIQYKYVHLISGADFWAMNPTDIFAQCENDENEYIECNPLPEGSTWTWGGECRYLVSYPKWMIVRPHTNEFARVCRIFWQEFIMRTKVFKRRKLPVNKFFGGSQWWSLTGNCVKWIYDYTTKRPEYDTPFIHGICIDEIYFSTLVMNSPFKDRVANNHKRFMIWNIVKTGGPSEITKDDVNDLVRSSSFFTRKVLKQDIVVSIKERLQIDGGN